MNWIFQLIPVVLKIVADIVALVRRNREDDYDPERGAVDPADDVVYLSEEAKAELAKVKYDGDR